MTPWDANTSNWASAPSLDRKYLWSGWRLLLETDVLASGGEAVLRKFTWGLDLAGLGGAQGGRASAGLFEQAGTIGGLLAVREYDVSGAPEPDDPVDYIYLYDAMSNVGQVVDWSKPAGQASAAVVAHYEYDPYGGVTKAQGAYASDNAWRFSTKQWDDETGLGYWGYRYYSPSQGRWVSRDPIEEEGGNSLYVFVDNATTSRTDSLGLIPLSGHNPNIPYDGPTDFRDWWYRQCRDILSAACDRYPCCNGAECRRDADWICRTYQDGFQAWRSKNPGHHMCMDLANAIVGLGLSGGCFQVKYCQNRRVTHAFAGVFHICNSTLTPDAVFDPWDLLDGTFPSYDPETHRGTPPNSLSELRKVAWCQ